MLLRYQKHLLCLVDVQQNIFMSSRFSLAKRFCFIMFSVFIVPALKFYPRYVAQYRRIVPKLKLILFDFHDMAGLNLNVTLASIHTEMKNRRIAIYIFAFCN